MPRLVVVYSGRTDLEEGPEGTPVSRVSSTLAAPRLLPFGRPEIDAILGLWPGPVTIAYLGPFGGALLTGEPPQRDDVSLLLAAREPNGMTASGGKASQSTAALVANALRDGVLDPAQYAPLVEFNRQLVSNQVMKNDWVPGTPAWLPNWSGTHSRWIARTQLAPLDRFAFLVAAGCALERLTACDLKSEDPFARLVVAARLDLEGQSTKAADDYTAVASELQKIASGNGVGLGAAGAQAALGTAAERIEWRARGEQSKTGRRVVILRIGVEDYASPLVADLPGTAGDLDAYSRVFTMVLASGTARVEVRDVALPKTAAEILASLRAERAALQPQDLLILVYSGRGVEIEGRRYLTPAGVAPREEAAGAFDVDSFEEDWPSLWSPADLVDLWQVAWLMRERWFMAIYDAQFTPSQLSERADQVLDKHLDSVRVVADQPEDGRLTTRPSAFRAVPRGEIPPRQLHLWVEGTLTAAARPPNKCVTQVSRPPIASPLAGAIVTNLFLQAPGTYRTYRDWLASLAKSPCLYAGPRLAAQGDLDVPLFASGDGAEFVDLFHKEFGRRDANLRAAHAVVESAAEHFPAGRNRLAHAAVLLALGTHAEQAESRGLAMELAPWLRKAESLLEDLQSAEPGLQEAAELAPLQLELLVRRHVLGGDAEQARKELRAAPAMLLERGLAERLVALTGEAVRRQPVSLVEDTARGLAEAERQLATLNGMPMGKVKTAKAQLARLLWEEQARRAEHFSIKPPGQSAPPPDGEP